MARNPRNKIMAKYTIHIPDRGGRVPVRPIGKLTHRGEDFFIHLHHYDRNKVGITHTETGLSAGMIDRYTGYRAIGMKRVANSKQQLLDAAEIHLGRVSDERFKAAMTKARGGA